MALRFGVNYVPARNWWFSWLDWDAAAIADDLAAIADLGLDHIRIHCLWPTFQPGPHYISPTALERLEALFNLADAVGLDVHVTVLNGWLSGFVFQPPWLGPTMHGATRNMFCDPFVLAAQQRLFTAIAERIGAHPRFLGFDLGNELGVLQQQLHPVALDTADAWARSLFDHCERLAPGKLHVNGVDHIHWFADLGFSRAGLATLGAATALHTWTKWTGALQRYGPAGLGSRHIAEYFIELARAYQTQLDRPIWVQEFGASPLTGLSDAAIADFAEQLVRNAVGSGPLWGFTWWCSHDFGGQPHLAGFGEGEYTLGLLTAQNRPKPVAARLAALAAEYRRTPPEVQPRPVALVLPDEHFAAVPVNSADPDWSLAQPFMDLIAAGIRPAIVLASRAADSAYCAARGIRECVPLAAVGKRITL